MSVLEISQNDCFEKIGNFEKLKVNIWKFVNFEIIVLAKIGNFGQSWKIWNYRCVA